MSDQIVAQWEKEQWDTQVKLRFQNRGYMLKGTTMPPVRIDGKKFHFLRTAAMEAVAYAKGDAVSAINPDDDTVEMQSSEWDAPFNLYDWDKTRIAPNEVDARQQQAAAALGRRADRIIYDAVMNAAIDGSQVFGDYTQPFDPYTLLRGMEKLADSDVGTESGVFSPLPSKAFYQCETYKIFANADWQGGDLPLTRMAKHKTFDVANCFILPPHLRKAYTTGTQLRFRVWVRDAIGAGANADLRTEWTREGRYKRWLVNNTIDGVAVPVQTEGIIEFRMKADSTIDKEVVITKEAA